MWTLAIPSLLLLFTSIEAVDPCAACTSKYNGTGDTNCTSLKTYLGCLETASGTAEPCALTDADALKIKNANCTTALPKACSCQKDLWGTNGISTDNCTALTNYKTCLNDHTVGPDTMCGVNVTTLRANAHTRLAACNPCTVNNCSGHGQCFPDTTHSPHQFSCKCNDSYEGDHCENEKTVCSPRPCKNGGKCNITDDGNYTCDCTSGYTGQNCGEASAATEISLSSFLASLLAANIIRMTLT